MSHENETEEFLLNISDQISAGKITGAKQTLTRSWRDAVPELPIRFAVILVDLDKTAVKGLLQRMRKNKSTPRLKLEWKKDKNKIEVHTSQGKTFRIGNLPASDSIMLLDLGKKAKKYKPKLLEIKQDENGEINYLAIELIRPETSVETQAAAAIADAVESINDSLDEEIDLGLEWEE